MTSRQNGTDRPDDARPNGRGASGTRPPLPPRGAARAAMRAAIENAPTVDEDTFAMPRGFEMKPDGLYWQDGDRRPLRVAGPFEVVAETRPEPGDEWGLLLRWRDRDGRAHEWVMPRRLLAGEGVEVRSHLAACGLDVDASHGARGALARFLAAVKVAARVRTVTRTGWYLPPGGGAAFVLPEGVEGKIAGEVVRLDIDPPPTVYRPRGTLDGWQESVAALCEGNTRLAFAVSMALAAPLLPLIGEEGGGFNLRGESSKGKTTVVDAAASVWGSPSKTGPDAFVRQWRSTSNALEATAAAHNHVLLPMDEMGQADPREVPETLYMLAHGTGKERARAGGGNRRGTTWLTLVLSTSEESAARLAEQAGRRIKAGQEVRMLDVPAVVAGGFGCFDILHGEPDGGAFALRLRRGAIEHHGTAGRAFARLLAAKLDEDRDFPSRVLLPRIDGWCDENVPPGADGQVRRAARRFAIVAAAGSLAAEAGILPWPLDEAACATAAVFRDWLGDRGGLGSREDHHLEAAFRRFVGAHGSSRFEIIRDPDPEAPPTSGESLPEGPRTIQRAGWKWRETNAAGEPMWVLGMLPEVFDAEIAAPLGMEGKEARARLGKTGLIRGRSEGGELRWVYKARRIPGVGRPRLIVIEPEADDPAP